EDVPSRSHEDRPQEIGMRREGAVEVFLEGDAELLRHARRHARRLLVESEPHAPLRGEESLPFADRSARVLLRGMLGIREELGERSGRLLDDATRDSEPLHGASRQIELEGPQNALEDRHQAASARVLSMRALGHLAKRIVLEGDVDAVAAKALAVLEEDRALGRSQDAEEVLGRERIERAANRETSDELGLEAEVDEVFRRHFREEPTRLELILSLSALEADAPIAEAARDDLRQPGERAADDEEDVPRVDRAARRAPLP